MRREMAILLLSLALGAVVFAQPPAQPQDEVAQLKATVYALQIKLLAVEQELGKEKARRAELEMAVAQQAAEGLDPAVRKVLGLSVKEQTPVPQTPAKPKG